MKMVVLISFLLGGYAFAEDKTCKVKGMHCENCVEAVQNKVCEKDKYATCDVKQGEIHLVTKEDKEKIDEKTVGAAVKDAGYTLQKCKMGKAKGEAKKAS